MPALRYGYSTLRCIVGGIDLPLALLRASRTMGKKVDSKASMARKSVAAMSDATLAFAEADKDGDQCLDFEEFYSTLSKRLRNSLQVEQVKQWFDAADADGDGTVSVDEFFLWSLSSAAAEHGAASVQAVFEKYDRDKTGYLDILEFSKACKDVAMGSVADDIFHSLDQDKSGQISYHELSDRLAGKVPTQTPEGFAAETKDMLSSLIWSLDRDEAEKRIDTSGWVVNGDTVESARNDLQALLRNSGHPIADLVRIFDQDTGSLDLQIDDMEFYTAIRDRCGFRGPVHIVKQLFRSLDTDRSGTIGFDELFEFVRGHRHCLDARNKKMRELRLEPPPGVALNDVLWEVDTLRLLMQQMLKRAGHGILDLIRSWDQSGDQQISLNEFVDEIRNFFRDVKPKTIWELEVDPVVRQTFREVDGSIKRSGISARRDGKLDMIELQAWFSKPTAGLKIELKSKSKRSSPMAMRGGVTHAATATVGICKTTPNTVMAITVPSPTKSIVVAPSRQQTLATSLVQSRRSQWEVPTSPPLLPPIPKACRNWRPSSKVGPRIDREPHPPRAMPIWYYPYARERQRRFLPADPQEALEYARLLRVVPS